MHYSELCIYVHNILQIYKYVRIEKYISVLLLESSLSTPFVRLTKPPHTPFWLELAGDPAPMATSKPRDPWVFRRRIFTLSSCTARHGACIAAVNCNLAKLMNFAVPGRRPGEITAHLRQVVSSCLKAQIHP